MAFTAMQKGYIDDIDKFYLNHKNIQDSTLKNCENITFIEFLLKNRF